MLLNLKGGASHGDTGSLGFIAAGDNATIVVRKHNNRLPVETWVKHPLTGDKEVIAVNKPVHR